MEPESRERWATLEQRIQRTGLRNSLLCAIAPTATIASIAGCFECIEPQVSNLFKRETLSGDFVQVNRYLVSELKALGLSIGVDTVGPEENALAATLGLEQVEEEGNGVGIAVIDSGLEFSEDLQGGRGDKFYDFTSGGRQAKPTDEYGHGTHVSTLIAGEGRGSERKQVKLLQDKLLDSKRPYAGVAPKARIISLKVLDENGDVCGVFSFVGGLGGEAQILDLLAAEGKTDTVLDAALAALENSGFAFVSAQLRPEMIPALSRHKGIWYRHVTGVAATSKSADFKQAMTNGQAYIGGIAGESWSRLLRDFF